MWSRVIAALMGAVGIAVFAILRSDLPTIGSDCEALSGGWLREPVAAISSVAIVVAGWVISRHRTVPGVALLLAGAASLAAHATAHPTARALDGILAGAAVLAVASSIVSDRPERDRLGAALGIGGIAAIVWLLARTDAPLCDALGPWGHGVWHLLIAVAAAVAFVPPRVPTRG